MDLLKRLQSGLYNPAYIAARLYPTIGHHVANVKFNNKLQGRQGRSFTDSELKEISKIISN